MLVKLNLRLRIMFRLLPVRPNDHAHRHPQPALESFEGDFATDEADGCDVLDAVVPPACVCSCGYQSHHTAAPFPFSVSFPHPFLHHSAIRRVHPAHARPRLRQTVLGWRVVVHTERVFVRACHVERESKLFVEWFPDAIRRSVFHRFCIEPRLVNTTLFA